MEVLQHKGGVPAWVELENVSAQDRARDVLELVYEHRIARDVRGFSTGVPGFSAESAPITTGKGVAYVALARELGSPGKAYPYDTDALPEKAILTDVEDEGKFVVRALRVMRAVRNGESRRL